MKYSDEPAMQECIESIREAFCASGCAIAFSVTKVNRAVRKYAMSRMHRQDNFKEEEE